MAESTITDREHSAALLAVADAAIVCRAVQRAMDRVRSLTKDDRSPVTVADYASQAVVAHRLAQADDTLRLVAEETSTALRKDEHAAILEQVVEAAKVVWPEADAAAVLRAIDLGDDSGESDRFWTLDPIDGTKGFLRGGQYAVSLGLVEQGAPTAGFLACPNMHAEFDAPFDQPSDVGRIFASRVGSGVMHAPGSSAPGETPQLEPLARAERVSADTVRLCESVEAAHSKHDDSQRIMSQIGMQTESVRLDSQAKYAVVARGQADVYLRMPTRKGYVERIWDHAAGALIATEGGCTVTDIEGNPLDFSHGCGLETNRGIVCADQEIHARILGAIADLGLK